MVEGSLVDGLEGGLLPAIQTLGEEDLRGAARTEIANGTSVIGVVSVSGVVAPGVVGVPSVVAPSVSGVSSVARRRAGAWDGAALVVECLDSSEVLKLCAISTSQGESGQSTHSGLAKRGVERISLDTGLLGLSGRCSSLGSRAKVPRSLVGTTLVDEGVANGTGDDVDVLRATLVERSFVDGLEAGFPAVIEALAELDLGDGTRAKVGITDGGGSGLGGNGGGGGLAANDDGGQ